MKKIVQYLLVAFVVHSTLNAQNNSAWTRINQDNKTLSDRNNAKPNADNQLFFKFDEVVLKQSLLSLEDKTSKTSKVEILIPNKNGKLERFSVWESSNFAPELQAQYPDIKSYAGIGVTDKKASVNFSLSPTGIQTMILRADEGSEFIEPYSKDNSVYVLFDSKNRDRGNLPFSCKTEDLAINKQLLKTTNKIAANNRVFKTLRLALSCTGEYATYHGGTIPLALAAMNATMTRVNGIFNKDLAVKLHIIGNDNLIIYTDASTDPYSAAATGLKPLAGCSSTTGDCPGTWNNELQTTLTNVIGEANYDIGHLFGASGGGGNAGCIGCVCDAGRNTESTPVYNIGKGSAFTSPSDGIPQGDTFDIDFVAHEMGHQLGANHTFSYDIEQTGVSVEPGSGSTIMGYAGITGSYDVQANSDDYFAFASIKQIQDNLSTKTCPVSTVVSNSPPIISAGLDYTIPTSTAFKLTGTGSDINFDTVSYCWEQNDTAIAQSGADSFAVPTKTDGPLFRSIYPSSSKVRYMPAYSSVLSNRLTSAWESVSSIGRALHFTLTGRDNAAQGAAQTNTDEMVVNVSGTVGPFAVTSQNIDDLSWAKGSSQTITWSVNGSNALAGSTNVNIKLSIDGGLTFSTLLIGNTPNDGLETITVPNVAATNCRILIEPTANIYYAVNSKAFAIGYSVTSSCTTYAFATPFNIPDNSTISKTINIPASTETIVDVNFAVSFSHKYLGDVQLEVVSPTGTIVKLFERSCGAADSSLILNYDDAGGALVCGTITAQTVAPFDPLSVFNGQNKQGFWTFRASDADTNDIGKVDSASITICAQSFTLAAPEFEINDFVLYPNPNKGNFNVQFTSASSNGVKVLVQDLLGRKLFENEFKNDTNFNENIQLKNAQPGIYLLTVIDGNRKDVRKIVIK
ncbi:reprolysin-like metallopeptidase [Flavobacterium sp. LS2P90]|uniref:Reprolysin-like metallopeptidase n=1 Tax=Flavobacterium xylosi TaxID=3230415 RepID=A0ABW6HTQ9_9FLAO